MRGPAAADIPATHQKDQLRTVKHDKCKLPGRLTTDFQTYVEYSSSSVVGYAERQRCGERASTDLVESAANQVLAKRFVKRSRMQWTKGAYLLARVCPKVLNEGWEACFRQQEVLVLN